MGKPSDLLKPDRYRSQARITASERAYSYKDSKGGTGGTILPTSDNRTNNTTEAGGLSEKHDGGGSPSGSAAGKQDGGGQGVGEGAGAGDYFSGPKESTHNNAEDAISKAIHPPAPPPHKSEAAGVGDTTVVSAGGKGKPSLTLRMKNGSKRFVNHMKNAILHSWVNVLLIFVPIGIAADAAGLSPAIIFAMNAVAIIPLAGLLAHATEAVAARLGDTMGALLNVSFGNAVELIIFIIALVKNEIDIVQASLLGSILANLLLILGMAFLFGGLRYREQIYNSTVTQMSACLLSLSVMSLLLPTAFYATFSSQSEGLADRQVLKVSRGTSVVLLLVYALYLLFQLKSHAYMYESTPQEIIDEESHPGVLADIMNSSSSSDDSSSTDSTDSDTSGSGSIANAGKRIKRVFKNRRRRKSSASISSVTESGVPSALSSPSTMTGKESYFESQMGSKAGSRRGSVLGAIASGDEADVEQQDNRPRIRDFVKQSLPNGEASKSPELKKSRKKHHKKHHKKRHQQNDEVESVEDGGVNVLGGEKVQSPMEEEPKTVGFADDVEMVGNQQSGLAPTKSAFNMRQLSSRANLPRPVLPKMLSNNVFVTPAPVPPTTISRPAAPISRTRSNGAGLRRTSSLPDRLNQQISNTPSRAGQAPSRGTSGATNNDPIPPYQHQVRKVASENVEDADDEEESENPYMSRTAAVVLLLCTTGLVAVCAEFMVSAIPDMLKGQTTVSQAFIGLIVLPIVGNAAEHVTAVTVAAKNKMDLAIGVAVGSSIQIALFVTPIIVLLGWILDTNMSLYFNLFETISLFVTAFVVNFLVLDGRSNYLEGSLLIAAYVIIALGAFFYPDKGHQSSVGGGAG